MAFAARSISSAVRMSIPLSTWASGMFGVMRVASPSSLPFSVSMASSLMSFAPLVATITGSMTRFLALYWVSFCAITSISALEDTIPVFTASGRMSVKIQSSWLARNSGVTSRMP